MTQYKIEVEQEANEVEWFTHRPGRMNWYARGFIQGSSLAEAGIWDTFGFGRTKEAAIAECKRHLEDIIAQDNLKSESKDIIEGTL